MNYGSILSTAKRRSVSSSGASFASFVQLPLLLACITTITLCFVYYTEPDKLTFWVLSKNSITYPTRSVDKFDRLYVFGDSLVDDNTNGTYKNGQWPPSPPENGSYFYRWTNGLVFPEYFRDLMLDNDLLNDEDGNYDNFAMGGATVNARRFQGEYGPNDLKSRVFDPSQINMFPDGDHDKDLIVITVGGNDINVLSAEALEILDYKSTYSKVAEELWDGIYDLYDKGGRHFVIFTTVDAALVPRSSMYKAIEFVTDPVLQEIGEVYARTVRDGRDDFLSDVNDTASVWIANLYGCHRDMNKKKYEGGWANFGFDNWKDACIDDIYDKPCEGADGYVFWDGIHPSTKAHQFIGNQLFSLVQDNTGCLTSTNWGDSDGNIVHKILIIAITVPISVCILCAVGGYCIYSKYYQNKSNSRDDGSDEQVQV